MSRTRCVLERLDRRRQEAKIKEKKKKKSFHTLPLFWKDNVETLRWSPVTAVLLPVSIPRLLWDKDRNSIYIYIYLFFNGIFLVSKKSKISLFG